MYASTQRRCMLVSSLLLAHGCSPTDASADTVAEAAPSDVSNSLEFDTWVPGPCSPNGQAQGQCPPGDRYRVRLVPVADGLRSARHIAFTPAGDLLITELAAPGSPV